MSSYYQHWVEMFNWRLTDAVRLICEYTTLLEGHEAPDDYSISLSNNTKKCQIYISKDLYIDKAPKGIQWIEITANNPRDFLMDLDGNEIKQVDYWNSFVDKEEFVSWAVKRKFKVPDEFRKLVENMEEPAADKNSKKLISSAVGAGIFCASQGVEVKKEQLQEKLGMYGPAFEDIWKEVPKNFKQPGGRPKKVVEKIIDAAVFTTRYVAENHQRIPYEKLKEKLESEKSLDKIDQEYVEMIKASIDAYFEDEYQR